MKSYILLLIVFSFVSIKAQLYTDCFLTAKEKVEEKLRNSISAQAGDTLRLNHSDIWRMIIGCKFPYAPTKTFDGKDVNPVTFKTDFVIINLNYAYCDMCTEQLEYFLKIKKESSKSIYCQV